MIPKGDDTTRDIIENIIQVLIFFFNSLSCLSGLEKQDQTQDQQDYQKEDDDDNRNNHSLIGGEERDRIIQVGYLSLIAFIDLIDAD